MVLMAKVLMIFTLTATLTLRIWSMIDRVAVENDDLLPQAMHVSTCV